MKQVMARVSSWWRQPRSSQTPYSVACACGQSAQGYRQSRHQVVPCPGCGRPLFVLPLSPLPPVAGRPGPIQQKQDDSPGFMQRHRWRLAGAVILLALLAGGVYLYHARSTADLAARLAAQQAVGHKALADGDFPEARRALGEARDILETGRVSLSAAERGQLLQLHRQAELLADWPREELAGVVIRLKDAEINSTYRGRPFLFDIEVRRDAAGQYHVSQPEPVAKVLRLDLADLKVLRPLPLEESQRLLFVARLAEARRLLDGLCLIRLDPDSGVLLTDPAAAARCNLLVSEGPLKKVLEKQQQWLAEQP